MRPNISCFSLLIVSLLFFLTFHSSIAHNLIHETCIKCVQNDPSLSYDFCVSTLQSVPSSHCARTLRQLGMISIKLTKYNLTHTRNYTRELLKNKKLDPFFRACLSDCFDLYSDAIPTVKEAMRNYMERKYKDANIEMSSVLDAAMTCEDGFKEKKGVVSPLKKINNDMFQLSAIALSIINMLH